MKPEETIDFNIRAAWHKISRMYNSEAAKYGITMAMGHVLLNIDSKDGTPSTSLGPKMGMESTSLSRILKSMEAKGLIYRKPDIKDKRVVRIFITDGGKEKRDISKNTVLDFNHAIQEKVSKKKLDNFFDVIGKIEELIEKQER